MKRLILFMLCFTLCFSAFAQEIDSDYVFRASQAGDQYAHVNLSLNIPNKPEQLKLGGSGSLGYHYFITDNITLGGNISFSYLSTLGENFFYFIPFVFKAGYQINFGKIEMPINLGFGAAIQNYIDRSYFGLVFNPNIGAYYRTSADFSFGVSGGVYILPQWYKNKTYNYTGIITDISLSVRYHF